MEQGTDRRWIILAVFALVATGIVAAILIGRAGGDDDASSTETATKPTVEVPDGPPPGKLVMNDLVEGTGAEAKTGDEIKVEYVGVGYESGEEFDASWGREPFPLTLGVGGVIPGWDQGIVGMKEGGRRELVIPPGLAYGEEGRPPSIAPNETLIFVIDLLEVS
jgi:peptidylprolyl isomerase